MPKWIEIEHPDVKVTAVVSEGALQDHLAASGWKKVGNASGPEQPGRSTTAAKKATSSTETKG